jgi:hypothetical protein
LPFAKRIDSFAAAMRHSFLQSWLMAGVYLLHLLFFESLMVQSAYAHIAGTTIYSRNNSRRMPVKGLIDYAQVLKHENNENKFAGIQLQPGAQATLSRCKVGLGAQVARLFANNFFRLSPAFRLYRLIQVFRI